MVATASCTPAATRPAPRCNGRCRRPVRDTGSVETVEDAFVLDLLQRGAAGRALESPSG